MAVCQLMRSGSLRLLLGNTMMILLQPFSLMIRNGVLNSVMRRKLCLEGLELPAYETYVFQLTLRY